MLDAPRSHPATRPPADVARAQAEGAAVLLARFAGIGRDVVVSPGSRSTPLALAAFSRPDLHVHVVLDERAAGFVALGLALARRRPVALVCTSGSAGAHYLPALCEARASGVPIWAMTADRPAELHGRGAPQTMPQRSLFGQSVVGSRHVEWCDADAARAAARWAAARIEEQAGPVHLNIAFRKPLWVPGVDVLPPPPMPIQKQIERSGYEIPSSIERWASVAQRVLVYCGAGATAEQIATASRVCAASRWPLLLDGPIPAVPHAESAACVTHHEAIARCAVMPAADLVVQVGRAPLSPELLRYFGRARRSVGLDVAGALHDPTSRGVQRLTDRDGAALERLAQFVGASAQAWADAWSTAETAAEACFVRWREADWEGAVARAVVEADKPRALHVAASMPVRDITAFGGHARLSGTIRCNRGLNGIDGLIATAAGAALTGEPVRLLCGDLAFLHDVGGLLAAGQFGVDLDIVAVNNGGGGIFGELPIAEHPSAFEALFLTPQRAAIGALARGAGACWVKTTSIRELRGELGRDWRGLRVIEHVIDRQQSSALRQRALAAMTAAVAAAVGQCAGSPR